MSRRTKMFAEMMHVAQTAGTYHQDKRVFMVHEDNLMDLLSAIAIASDGAMCEEIELVMEWSDDE